MIIFIVTFRLSNNFNLKSYFSDQSCHLSFSSNIHQNPREGVTTRGSLEVPEETGVNAVFVFAGADYTVPHFYGQLSAKAELVVQLFDLL